MADAYSTDACFAGAPRQRHDGQRGRLGGGLQACIAFFARVQAFSRDGAEPGTVSSSKGRGRPRPRENGGIHTKRERGRPPPLGQAFLKSPSQATSDSRGSRAPLPPMSAP